MLFHFWLTLDFELFDIHASPVVEVKLNFKMIMVNRSSAAAVHQLKLLGFSRVSHDWQLGVTEAVPWAYKSNTSSF